MMDTSISTVCSLSGFVTNLSRWSNKLLLQAVHDELYHFDDIMEVHGPH